jgi:hypothetical protein
MSEKLKTRNSELLESFMDYCLSHPEQRFWQALRNWSGWSFVFVGNMGEDGLVHPVDTFHWEDSRPRKEV